MATTKKSTKAKSKTVKKPATKSASAARASKKSVTTKPVKPVKPAAVAPKSPAAKARNRNPLFNLMAVSVLISTVLAVLAGVFMTQKSYQIFTGLLTKDELASTTTTVLVPAFHTLYDIELRWIVVATMVISALFPLLYLTRLKRLYQTARQERVFLWRWVENGIVGALGLIIISLLSGIQDLATLKLVAGLVVVSSLLSWMAEKQHTIEQRPARAAYWLSIVTGSLPWLLIGVYAVATPVYGLVQNTAFVYGLYAIALAGFIATALNLRRYLRGANNTANYESVESNYWKINLLTRTAFALTIIVGLVNR